MTTPTTRTYRYGGTTLVVCRDDDRYDVTLLVAGRIARPEQANLSTALAHLFEPGERPHATLNRTQLTHLQTELRRLVRIETCDERSNLYRYWSHL